MSGLNTYVGNIYANRPESKLGKGKVDRWVRVFTCYCSTRKAAESEIQRQALDYAEQEVRLHVHRVFKHA